MSLSDRDAFKERQLFESVRSFLIVLGAGWDSNWRLRLEQVDPGQEYQTVAGHGASIAFLPRIPTGGLGLAITPARCLTLVTGNSLVDPAAWEHGCQADAAKVDVDVNHTSVRALTSIVALPGIFLYQDPHRLVMTTDLFLLNAVPGLSLQFNRQAVRESAFIGHPVGFRTLFQNVSLLPGGHEVRVDAHRNVSISAAWAMPETDPAPNWRIYLEMQIEAFEAAMDRIKVVKSVLSLTGGLDTRTILAALTRSGRPVPACTMSGMRTLLDATIARQLCRNYGINHEIIPIAEDFLASLPSWVESASRLSGGLTGISQAHEVYFNHMLAGQFQTRISGFLGNQVGRLGTEKVSYRRCDLSLLAGPGSSAEEKYWYEKIMVEDGHLDYRFLLQEEVPFSSVGNYSIGSRFLTQQSPYADRTLIELYSRRPLANRSKSTPSFLRLRLNDLHHRFLGEPADVSFQRTFVNRAGGYAAECPINWGWQAKGGMSFRGLVNGNLALLDAFTSRQKVGGMLESLLEASGITGRHEYLYYDKWISLRLKDMVGELLLGSSIRGTDLFEPRRLEHMYWEWRSGKSRESKNLIFAVDMAMAAHVFKVTC